MCTKLTGGMQTLESHTVEIKRIRLLCASGYPNMVGFGIRNDSHDVPTGESIETDD